jgi:hypothetical protein
MPSDQLPRGLTLPGDAVAVRVATHRARHTRASRSCSTHSSPPRLVAPASVADRPPSHRGAPRPRLLAVRRRTRFTIASRAAAPYRGPVYQCGSSAARLSVFIVDDETGILDTSEPAQE